MSDWQTDEYGHRWRAASLPPPEPPSRGWYEARYREARARLHELAGQNRARRKHWQGQLWTMRACLKSYFGAEPPE